MNVNIDKAALEQAILALIEESQGLSSQERRLHIQRRLAQLDMSTSMESSREVTILLSDIRGFTSIAERFSATDILRMLNHYFGRMNDIVVQYGGMIDKYMGDAIMVVFGIPTTQPEDAANAVACAIEMQLAMDDINRFNQENGYPEIFAGIGLNTDTVSSGNLGSEIHNEFTVIGDGVNLASRIESHSLRGQVLMSEATFAKVADIVTTGQVNKVFVKGKQAEVSLYEVMALDWQGRTLTVPKREIRTSVRLALHEPLSCYRLHGKDVDREPLNGMIEDLSYHGMFITLKEELPVFTNIRFSLALSLMGGSKRDIYGKVVSVRSMADSFGYGIEFTDMDEASSQSIRDYINRIIAGA